VLIINEWRFCLRQPLILLSLILMPLFALILSGGIVEGNYSATSQLQLTQVTLLMVLLPIVLGTISPTVFLRDLSANMDELINSTPLSHSKRWLLRYCTVVSLFLVIFILSFSIVLASYAFEFGSFIEFLIPTIFNLVLLVLPSILITTAFALWLSTYWQSAMVMYACISAFGMSYLVLSSMTGSPVLAGSSVISENFYHTMLWLDPYGITALLDNIKSGTSYSSELLANRLIYSLLSVVFVYAVLSRKTTLMVNKKHKKSKDTTKQNQQTNTVKERVSPFPASPFIQLIKVPFFTLLRSRITQIILCIWPMIIFNEVMAGIQYGGAMSVLSSNSIDALNLVAIDVFSVLGAFVIALWSWFICSQDKNCNIAELIAAAPISSRQLVCAQIFALGLMIIILLLLTFVGSSLAEFSAGSEWLIDHYLLQLSLSGLPLLLLGSLFICIHHLCRSTAAAGGIIALIILIKFSAIMTSLGMTHTLWNIAGTPLQEPDNFWGYAASMSVYLPYITVWLIACISMILLTISRSHRGTNLGELSLKGLPKSVLFSFTVTLLAGMNLHFALVDEKPLTNSAKREMWKAQYETSFGEWQHKAQPTIVHIDSEVDIYPEEEFTNFKLSYTLKNYTTSPINQVLIGRYGNYAFGNIAIEGATLVEFNTELNQGIYQFSQTLLPGEQRILHAKFSFKQSQLWPHRSHQVVKPEFSYFRANPLLPTVGYQTEYQLETAQTRAKYELTDIENLAPSEIFKNDKSAARTYQWASLSTVISTKEGHHALSQGELINSWQQGQRTFFKFQTKTPIRAIPTWLSVPYSALTKNVQGTTLNVFSPEKNKAAKVTLNAMADTLTWFAQHITPYTGAQLSLFAAPDIGPDSYSVPQVMLINNNKGFRTTPSEDASFDQRYRRVIHETAQQWFGHDIGNGADGDRLLLRESMAKYIELVIIEKHYGKEAMLKLVELEQKHFALSQRNNMQTPVALIDAIQKHDVLSRASIVFAELRETVGDKSIIAALKSLWEAHAYPKTPATSMDFVNALRRHSAVTHHPRINELFLNSKNHANNR